MPTREERTLRLIKGAKPGTPTPNRRRRAFTRHLPGPGEPVEALLKTIDEEPVRDDGVSPPASRRSGKESQTPAAGRQPAPAADPPADGGPAADGSAPDEPGTDGRASDGAAAAAPTRRRRVLVGLLLIALAAALAAAGVLGQRWYADRTLTAAHAAAVAAARQTTVNFVSVSASSVDRDLQRISAGATGEFKEQFDRGQAQVRAAVVENKVESRGTVLRAGLVSGDHRSAVVLVAIDATVKNVNAPDGRPSHYRIQVDMTRDADSGAWLVSRLQFVG
ncbi:hypothetical protein SAMN05444365_10978 [Micromonospora pattaloongensis]|uniref:Mce-associated membrane protein n=2 Tax=Micromonospora pattaloongensis TaxID=405436 RepID=A0A1H3RUX0_9ACTN|nr:hypothetical protein SAMN05444365_10978 [Micromonospora pattaloongensis]